MVEFAEFETEDEAEDVVATEVVVTELALDTVVKALGVICLVVASEVVGVN